MSKTAKPRKIPKPKSGLYKVLKLLLTYPTFDAFPAFYRMARAACKGKGKPTPPSEKKRKSREKPPTRPQ